MKTLTNEGIERKALVKISDLLDKIDSVADTLSLIADSDSTSTDERLADSLAFQAQNLYEAFKEGKAICNSILLSGKGEKSLQELRLAAGLGLSEASDKIGVAPETLDSWEKGFAFPSLTEITKIENVYGVSYNDIRFLPVLGK